MREIISKLDYNLDWTQLPGWVHYTVEQSTTLQQIPAPTFGEKERAVYMLECFRACGLQDLSMDAVFNVYGRLPGRQAHQPAVMVSAHTDTVFPGDTDLTLRYDGNLIHGPGLGDNCFGLGGMLGLLTMLRDQQIIPARDIWFVATSREEGLGDLGGMKVAFDTLRQKVGSIVNLEGLAFGHIYHAGIAVRRLHITAKAGGGHSWLHFGRPSAIHGIMQLGGKILSIELPHEPRTTYNIGMIEGGQGINVIATSAGLWLDLRSEDLAALNQLEQQVQQHIQSLVTADLQFETEIVGDRPAGRLDMNHPLVQMALAAVAQVGGQGVLETGSTDANIPLAAGCPAVTVGITRGGNAHRLDEYVELEPVAAGLRQLILLVLAAAENL